MSQKYNIVKNAYDRGTWNLVMVRNAVIKGWITTAEYKEITGEDYEATGNA